MFIKYSFRNKSKLYRKSKCSKIKICRIFKNWIKHEKYEKGQWNHHKYITSKTQLTIEWQRTVKASNIKKNAIQKETELKKNSITVAKTN